MGPKEGVAAIHQLHVLLGIHNVGVIEGQLLQREPRLSQHQRCHVHTLAGLLSLRPGLMLKHAGGTTTAWDCTPVTSCSHTGRQLLVARPMADN